MKGGKKGKGERKRGKKNYFRTNDGAKYNQGNVDGGMSLSRARRKRVERGGRGGWHSSRYFRAVLYRYLFLTDEKKRISFTRALLLSSIPRPVRGHARHTRRESRD